MAIQDNVNSVFQSAASVGRTYLAYSAKEALQSIKLQHAQTTAKNEEVERVKGTLVDPGTDVIPGTNFTMKDKQEPIDADYTILSDQDDKMVLKAKKSLIKYNKAKQLGKPKGGIK